MTTSPSPRLSGRNYVGAVMRHPEPGQAGKYCKIRLGPTVRFQCEHVHTICVKCAAIWNRDYELQLWRTQAGRDMGAQLQKSGVDMSKFTSYSR